MAILNKLDFVLALGQLSASCRQAHAITCNILKFKNGPDLEKFYVASWNAPHNEDRFPLGPAYGNK
jgi:hypothetical protein